MPIVPSEAKKKRLLRRACVESDFEQRASIAGATKGYEPIADRDRLPETGAARRIPSLGAHGVAAQERYQGSWAKGLPCSLDPRKRGEDEGELGQER